MADVATAITTMWVTCILLRLRVIMDLTSAVNDLSACYRFSIRLFLSTPLCNMVFLHLAQANNLFINNWANCKNHIHNIYKDCKCNSSLFHIRTYRNWNCHWEQLNWQTLYRINSVLHELIWTFGVASYANTV